MITRDRMFAPMLAACPGFKPAWDEFLASEITNEPEEGPLYYTALGDLARHLIKDLLADRTSHFGPVFDVVETWIVDGDEYVRDAAAVGLLEGLQNHCGHSGVDAELFRPWLRSESIKAWDALNAFWAGN
jgi:hypothetical protein